MATPLEIVVRTARKDLKDLINGKTLGYRKEVGNLVALLPGYSFATLIAVAPELRDPIRKIGKTAGSKIVAGVIEPTSLKGVLGEIAKLIEVTKMGKVKVTSREKKKVIFRIYECADCGGIPNVDRSLCAFDEGLIEGTLETNLGKKVRVREGKCWGTGYDFCEFEVKV